MSDATDIDREEQLVRVDRMLAERQKLLQEALKFERESLKPQREGRKYERDRFLAPFALVVGAMGAGAALFAAALAYARYLIS